MKKFLILIIVAFAFSSCEKFLDVTPTNLAYDNELLTDRSGFETALAGAYSTLSSDTLYGRELKFGFMESLVGSYSSLSSSHQYYRAYRHEFNYEFPKATIKNIWGGLYRVINQCNIILNHVDNIQSDPNHDIVKGEALALRAFSHFQLLKMFGPVLLQEGINAQAIPYRDHVSVTATKFANAQEVHDKLDADLLDAKSLLEKDPIRTNDRAENLNQFAYEKYNSLLDRRGTRMNYYAVVALQAQVAQWFGDNNTAGSIAETLIDELNTTKSIRFSTINELTAYNQNRMPMENVFALLNQDLREDASHVLARLEDPRSSSTSPLLFPNYSWLRNNLYNAASHGSTNDYRLVNWFKLSSNSTSLYKLNKYIFDLTYQMSNANYTPLFENKVISLHQIYMIAAESLAASNPQKAIDYLNKVRNARDLGVTSNIMYTANMTTQTIKDYIFDECRKENIGEGYLYTEYKRLFKNIHRSTPVVASLNIFKFPVPDDELLYNPQN